MLFFWILRCLKCSLVFKNSSLLLISILILNTYTYSYY